jgi:hypothetical protein
MGTLNGDYLMKQAREGKLSKLTGPVSRRGAEKCSKAEDLF